MKNSGRYHTNKRQGARAFRHEVSRTHPRNVAQAPRRGGWRL